MQHNYYLYIYSSKQLTNYSSKTKAMIIKIFKVFFLVFLIYSYTGCKTTKPVSHDGHFADSDYIFQGEVVQAHKSNLQVVPDSDNTYIVKVNTIILASNGHESFEGENITVVADNEKLSALKERTGYIFYTHTWLFGSTLAVRANHADPGIDKTEELKKELLAYQDRENKVKLQERLKMAELVVHGHVLEVQETDIQEATKISEHSPGWKIAIVEIRNLLKGNEPDSQIQVYYSASNDIQWFNAPKLEKDQNAIYLLKRTDDFMGVKNAFLLIDPDDLLPESELKNVKKLLRN